MNEEKKYIDEKGNEWERIFTIPQAVFDSSENIDPFSEKQFADVTGKKKGVTIGDLWDKSEELSKKRIEKYGTDPIKNKAVNKYIKKTGKMHPLAVRQDKKRKIKNYCLPIDLCIFKLDKNQISLDVIYNKLQLLFNNYKKYD